MNSQIHRPALDPIRGLPAIPHHAVPDLIRDLPAAPHTTARDAKM